MEGKTILDRHFAFLLSPDPLRSTAVPQRRSETASVSLDWAQRRGWQLECLSKFSFASDSSPTFQPSPACRSSFRYSAAFSGLPHIV